MSKVKEICGTILRLSFSSWTMLLAQIRSGKAELTGWTFLSKMLVGIYLRQTNRFMDIYIGTYMWVKVFKYGQSKICVRQPLKNLKEYGLLKQTILPSSFTWSILEYFVPCVLSQKQICKYEKLLKIWLLFGCRNSVLYIQNLLKDVRRCGDTWLW